MIPIIERYRASMVLAGVGDALGYNNGRWEFCFSGPKILQEFEQIGGLEKININKMRVSDDQVMHLATADALTNDNKTFEELMQDMSKCYVESFNDMNGRSPGPMTSISIAKLESDKGGGCGGSMRAMCIGLRYAGEDQRDNLIAVSIDSGRMTHNHPTAFFGALTSALFTAYAIEGVPVVQWGRNLIFDILPRAYSYVEKTKRCWSDYQPDLLDFQIAWKNYLNKREIFSKDGNTPVFPTLYGPEERDAYYKSISFAGWGGASGHDSVIIAYDALLGANDDFLELVKRGVLHGGDNDSTGVIACAWWGALNGFEGVPERIWQNVEYRNVAENFANSLFNLSHSSPSTPTKPSP